MKRAMVGFWIAALVSLPLLAGCGGKSEGPGKTEAPEAADQMKAAQAKGLKQGGATGSGMEKMKQGQGAPGAGG